MKWSWNFLRVAGIDIHVHVTFILLLVWIGFIYWTQNHTLFAVLDGILFVLALFACVVLHELGHALTARRFGITTKDIILLPIGGVAMLEKMPDNPKEEILVALAGPAVNLVIAALLWLWLGLTGAVPIAEQFQSGEVSFLARLLVINIFLAVFNLLPAFPMDGGRVLRAALAMRMNKVRATGMAATIGQVLALWLGLIGIFYNPFLIIIAVFIWFGAAAEASVSETKSAIEGINVGRAMETEFHTLSPDDPLDKVIDLTLAGTQKDFPVMLHGEMVGVLSQADFLRGLQEEYGRNTRVDSVMKKCIQSAQHDEPLESVLERLQTGECRLIAVMRHGKLAGIIDMDNIMELIKIQSALHQH